jgi:hypothetical protein
MFEYVFEDSTTKVIFLNINARRMIFFGFCL